MRLYPRYRRAVVEAQHEIGPHGHAALPAHDQPYQVGDLVARRHEIHERHDAFGAGELGLEDQRARRGTGARPAIWGIPEPRASAHARACPAARRSMRPSRSEASTASRSIRHGRPALRSRSRRSARSPRCAGPSVTLPGRSVLADVAGRSIEALVVIDVVGAGLRVQQSPVRVQAAAAGRVGRRHRPRTRIAPRPARASAPVRSACLSRLSRSEPARASGVPNARRGSRNASSTSRFDILSSSLRSGNILVRVLNTWMPRPLPRIASV